VLAGKLREPPATAGVPTWVRDIVERGLSRARDDRYPSMKAMLAVLEHDPAAARRRRLAVAGIATAFVALAAGLVFAITRSGGEAKDPCAGVDKELDGIWDDEVKAATKQALLASGRAHAQETYERVVKLIDAYTDEWTTLRSQTCEAAQRTGDQADQLAALRSVCLAQRRDELEAVTGFLSEESDKQIADKAILFAVELTPVDSCTGKSAVPVVIPPPDAPGLRARVTALRKQLARARVRGIAGRLDAGLDIARRTLAEARALAYEPLEAETLFEIGQLQALAWEPEAARSAFVEAAAVAERARHDTVAARARVALLAPAFSGSADSAALRANAEAALARVGGNEHIRAQFLRAVGARQMVAGKHDEAVGYVKHALEIFERVLPPEHIDTTSTLNLLGNALIIDGRLNEATAYFERALAMEETAYGAENPNIAKILDSMGWLHTYRGEYEIARRYLERSRALFEESFGSDSTIFKGGFYSLAEAYYWDGKPVEARRALERGFTEDSSPLWSFRFASPPAALCWVLGAEGRPEEALAKCREALALAEQAQPAYARGKSAILTCLGRALVDLGRPGEAIEPLTRALELYGQEMMLPEVRPEARFTLARALWDSKRDRPRAVEVAKQALAEYQDLTAKGFGCMVRDLAAVEDWLRERGVK